MRFLQAIATGIIWSYIIAIIIANTGMATSPDAQLISVAIVVAVALAGHEITIKRGEADDA